MLRAYDARVHYENILYFILFLFTYNYRGALNPCPNKDKCGLPFNSRLTNYYFVN